MLIWPRYASGASSRRLNSVFPGFLRLIAVAVSRCFRKSPLGLVILRIPFHHFVPGAARRSDQGGIHDQEPFYRLVSERIPMAYCTITSDLLIRTGRVGVQLSGCARRDGVSVFRYREYERVSL
jgi:hypothetical protein